MPLSWNEIRTRATAFSVDWRDAHSEDADAKSFWDAFFAVFGVSRRKVASFEKRVDKLGTAQGKIDLLWKGTLLVEHKSRGATWHGPTNRPSIIFLASDPKSCRVTCWCAILPILFSTT